MLQAELAENGFTPNQYLDKKHLDEVLEKLSYRDSEALFAAVGFGEISATSVFNRLTENERRKVVKEKLKAESEQLMKGEVKRENKNKNVMKIRHDGGVSVSGVDSMLIHISKCCNPVPGDKIVGYITKGRLMNKIRTEKGDITTDPEEIQNTIRNQSTCA